jgi:hypothetical protein
LLGEGNLKLKNFRFEMKATDQEMAEAVTAVTAMCRP